MFPPSFAVFSSLTMGAATFFAATSAPSVWDRVTQKYVADLTPTIRALGIDESKIPTYLRWWGIALVANFMVFAFVLRMFPVALPTTYLAYIAPRLWLKWKIRQRQFRLRDQLVGATVALANTARAGMSLSQGIESVAKETPLPLAKELTRITLDHKRGLPLPRAIDDTKERLQLESFTLFAAAVLTCLERGGKVTEALDRISNSLQENQRIERKLEAETASGRKVVRILAV